MQSHLALGKIASIALLIVIPACTAGIAAAQTQKGGGGSNSAASQASTALSSQAISGGQAGSGAGAGGSSLQGISFSRASWSKISALPPPETFFIGNNDIASFFDDFNRDSFRKNVIIFCYTLKPNLSATVPFVLEPTPYDSSSKVDGYELCSNQVKSKHRAVSLIMGRYVVFRIDISEIPEAMLERIQTMNINLSSQAGTSLNSQRGPTINPTTTRPSMALLSGQPFPCPSDKSQASLDLYKLAGENLRYAFCPQESPDKEKTRALYLTWPGPLVGDTTPSVSINLIYTPVAPAIMFQPQTFYPAGSIVISQSDKTTNGHYYLALRGGLSGSASPDFNQGLVPVPEFREGGVYWIDRGPILRGTTVQAWEGGLTYQKDDTVSPQPSNGHYYQALTSGVSGVIEPKFPVTRDTVYDSAGLTWRNAGPGCQQSTAPAPTSPAPVANKGTPQITPIPSLALWKPRTPYLMGAFVVPPGIGNCHFYQAQNQGNSDAKPPVFKTDGTATQDGQEKGGVKWLDMGLITIPAWQAQTGYDKGAYVTPSPANGIYYKAIAAGVSGLTAPPFPVKYSDTVTESVGLIWMDVGSSSTPPAEIKTLKDWTPNTVFILGDGLLDSTSGHYYVSIQPGISGGQKPPFSVPTPQRVPDSVGQDEIQWQDLGSTLPPSTSVGTQPSDQVVNLLNLTYPQVHVNSRFNLTSGVVVSSLSPPSITSYPGTGPTPNGTPPGAGTGCPTGITSCTVYTSSRGSRLVDPVLGITVYALKPLDAERPFRYQDFIPAPTLNISLSSPTSNFYLGAASEFFIRNLQIVYGASFIQETRLSGTIETLNGQPISLFTDKHFNKGAFLGLTFNISGFIQTLIP